MEKPEVLKQLLSILNIFVEHLCGRKEDAEALAKFDGNLVYIKQFLVSALQRREWLRVKFVFPES